MSFSIIEEISWINLESRHRGLTLVGNDADGKKIYPYKNAKISLRTFYADELNPLAFYLVEKNLVMQQELRKLLRPDRDTFALNRGIQLNHDGQNWLLIPPVVEVAQEDIVHCNRGGNINYNGTRTTVQLPVIIDGLHRTFLARSLDEPITCIYISHVASNAPVGALPNSWDQVKIFSDVPKTFAEKKMYRTTQPYPLYRDFESFGTTVLRATGDGVQLS